MKYIKIIHLWLGFVSGLFASVSGFTGALYVWQPEIVSYLNPELLLVNNKEKILEEQVLRTTQILVNENPNSTKILLPYREQQTIAVIDENGETTYYHPKTGQYLGEKSRSIEFFENLLKIHRTLGIPIIGKYIVGTSTVIFFLFLLSSGVIIWWKRYHKNLKKGVLIKWKAMKKRVNYDLHKSLGILFFIPLTIIAFTGGYFTYYTYYKKGLSVFDHPRVDMNNVNTLSIEKALYKKDSVYFLRAIYFPENELGTFRFRYINHREINNGLRKTKEIITSYDHKVLQVSDYKDEVLSNKITAQMYPIHIGEILGRVGRFIVFICGLVPILLFVTGIRYFLFRKNR